MLIIFLLLFSTYSVGNLNVGVALVIIILILVFDVFITLKAMSTASQSKLYTNFSGLNWEKVINNGTVSSAMIYKYEAEIYNISRVNNYKISNSSFFVWGSINKKKVTRYNYGENIDTMVIQFVKIPNYFTDKEKLISILNELK